MTVRDDRSDVKQTTTGFRGPLMVQSLTSAKSKFLSLEEREALQELVESLDLSEKVLFLGQRNDIQSYMRLFDILVLPSKDEPFGRVLIEAMQVSCPVLGMASGGVPEIIEDGVSGIIQKEDTPSSLSETINSLLDSSEYRKELAEKAIASVQTKFSVKVTTESISELYKNHSKS